MPYLPLKRRDLPRVLMDADFPPEKREEILELYDSSQMDALFSLLSEYRNSLLHTIHLRQENLDCLDYLIYQLKKTSKV